MRMQSMGGISSKRIPGLRCLRGPRKETGLTRSDHRGSVSMLKLSLCSRNVEWFTKRNAKLAAADSIRRPWSGRRGDESAPWTYLPTSDPLERFGEALWQHSRIEEAAVLKMTGSAGVSCHSEFCPITMHTQALAQGPLSYRFDLRIGQVFVATAIGMLF